MKEPDLHDVSVSPDGTHVALVWNVEKKGRFVVVRDMTKAGMPIVGSMGDKVVRPDEVEWANNDRMLVKLLVPYKTARVRRQSEKKEDFDIKEHYSYERFITIDKKGKNIVRLMENYFQSTWSENFVQLANKLIKDGKHIIMRGPSKFGYALYKVSGNTGKIEGYYIGGDLRRIVFFNKKFQERYNQISEKVGNYNFFFNGRFSCGYNDRA